MAVDTGLLEHCHVNTNVEGDRFVGIRADSQKAVVCFPICYRLSETDQALRRDILHLIAVLAEFSHRADRLHTAPKRAAPRSVAFPIHAYLEIIHGYLQQNAYYTETEPVFKPGDHGRVDWARTIRRQRPLLQADGSPVYTGYIVRVSSPNDRNLITQIHRYCVYESFLRLGWLFTAHLPPRPGIEKNTNLFLHVLTDKLANTNNDRDKRLFAAMIALLRYVDTQTNPNEFSYGTDRFEYVWEKLIDRVFGIRDKVDFLPRTRWNLKGRVKQNAALEPDTIMLWENKLYVLDAKYYRYGATGNPAHLPSSASINKQITYGEYIHIRQALRARFGPDTPVYSAFLLPYNRADNTLGLDTPFGNIGEATGDWKQGGHPYQRVQGMVVDIRYLMHHYTGDHTGRIRQLAQAIEQALAENGGPAQPAAVPV